MLCIRNGRIHDMVHPEAFVGDILIENGKLVEIGGGMKVAAGTDV